MSKSSQAEYEARKKVRNEMAAKHVDPSPIDLLDIADRFVTAIERIADALEKKP